MKRIPVILALAAPIALAWGCGGGGDDPVLAEVGSRSIRTSDFLQAYSNLKPEERTPIATLEEKQAFLDDLINKEVMELLAFEEYPELVERQTWRLKRYREKELTDLVRHALIRDQIPITDAMKDRFYENMKRQRKLQAMLVIDPDAAAYVRAKLDEGVDFGTLSRDYSAQWSSAQVHGELDWQEPGVFPYEVDVAVWDAEIGSIVGPIETGLGSYIIRVLDERPNTVTGTREQLDELMEQRILEPLYLARQKAVQDSLREAADPYVSAEARALITMKYYWEPDEEKADDPMAVLDADRITPTFTADEAKTVIVDFKNAPDWTVQDFAERLSWYPGGLWPRGQSEEQLMECIDMMLRDYLQIKAAQDLGFENEAFEQQVEKMSREMRVTYYYYNNIMTEFAPTDDEILDWFSANRERYKAPPAYKVAFFGTQVDGVMEDLVADWKAGMSFVQLREKYEPRDPELTTIGESEWLYEGQDVIRDDMISVLKEGGITEPVTRSDFHMAYKLIATRPSRLLQYGEVKDQVDDDAKIVLVDQRLQNFLKEKRAKFGVKIHEKRLAAVEPPAPVAAGPAAS